jgi:predicted component of type VI protein secretion system
MKDKNKYDYLLKEYPSVINKNQLYRICHISKRTAKHLLDNGYIPCVNSGKKTRKYKIELTDVIKYLEARDKTPEVFAAPVGWYQTGTNYVHNIKKYLLATLFNAPSTIDSYYSALVKHDLYGRNY